MGLNITSVAQMWIYDLEFQGSINIFTFHL